MLLYYKTIRIIIHTSNLWPFLVKSDKCYPMSELPKGHTRVIDPKINEEREKD